MNSKQIFMIVAIVAALNTVMIATPVMAQNMTNGNTTSANMTGKISFVDPLDTNPDFLARSGCPADAEGIERCPPSQEPPGTDSNGETNGDGNGDASGDGNGEDSSNGNENDDNQ
jgi:hypothetical protein